MLIAILNQSNLNQPNQSTYLVSDADVKTMTQAIASQIQSDVAPLWGRAAATVTFNPTPLPPDAYVVAIVDSIPAQQTGVVGSHSETQTGQVSGIVAAQPILANNGQVLTGDLATADWSVSSTLSHEVLEMFIDPNCNMWANDGNGSVYGLEVCDPVEGPPYTVTVGSQDVWVSNFVTPAWFDPQAPAGSQVDFQGLLTKTGPFTILPGGYMTYESKSGKLQQQFGTAYPAWRQAIKSSPQQQPQALETRGQRRLVQLGAMYHQ
jgi:hypothetical protein